MIPTGIFTYADGIQAVVMRDNFESDYRCPPEWRFEVCFAKVRGIGRNGSPEYPFGNAHNEARMENRTRMVKWCDDMGIEVYHIFPSGVGFPTEQDQILCYLAWK
jgi:hypothetical protein